MTSQKILIVEDIKLLKRVSSVIDKLKHLKQVVLINPSKEANKLLPERVSIYNYDEILLEGQEEAQYHPDVFEKIISDTPESDLATIIYTSGTTGKPKGAAIKQLAFTQMLLNVQKFSHHAFDSKDRALTFLPLSHVFGRADSFLPLIFVLLLAFFFIAWVWFFSSLLKSLNPLSVIGSTSS